jgi:tetratricopeptide (TPR) repeat protein
LEEARLKGNSVNKDAPFDLKTAASEYAEAFREYGIDVQNLEPFDAAQRIIGERAIREHLTVALDHWASLSIVDAPLKRRLITIVSAADADAWRSEVRAAATAQDRQTLKHLADSPEVLNQPPPTLNLLASYFHGQGETEAAIRLLQKAQRRYPGDFWINDNLAFYLLRSQPPRSDEAIAFLTTAIAVRPQSLEVRVKLGTVLRRKNPDEALNVLREAVRIKPDSAAAHYHLGQFLCFPKQDYREAIAEYSRAIELSPTNASGWLGRSSAYRMLGRWDKALGDATQGATLDPTRPNAWLALAEASWRLGHRAQAIADYSRAIHLKSDYVLAFRGRGRVYLELGQRETALADCSKAIEQAPSTADFLLDRARLYEDMSQWDNALKDYSEAIKLWPNNANTWLRRGQVYRRLGERNKAVLDFTEAIKLNANFLQAWMDRGYTHGELRQWDKAIADFTQAIKLKPDYPWAWQGRGDVYIDLGHPDKAIADFTQAIELDRKRALSWLSRGKGYHRLGHPTDAVADFTKAIELDARHAESWCCRAQVYRQLGQWDKAIADYSRTIAVEPRYDQAWMERGWVHAELRQWKEAAADYAKAVALRPDAPSYWDYSAMAHLAAGNTKAYRDVCHGMVERFKNTKDSNVAERVVVTCVAAPEAIADSARLVALAELACSVNREWTVGVLGAARYRADKVSPALECLREKAKSAPPRAWDLLFMALAHHRLGQTADVRDCQARATQWLSIVGPPGIKGGGKPEPKWFNWQEEVAVESLRGELETRLKGADEKGRGPDEK